VGIAANIPYDVETLRAALHNSLIRIKLLEEQLKLSRSKEFGSKSERLDPGQLRLALDLPAPVEQKVVETVVPAHKRRKEVSKGHGRGHFHPSLPREFIDVDVPEAQRCCPMCSAMMSYLGIDESESAKLIPAKLVIECFRLKKYACPHGHGIVTAAKPCRVIKGGKCDASVYSAVVTNKYCDHIPLSRIQGILQRIGIDLPKQTQWDMLVQFDSLAAQAIVGQMRKEIRNSPVLFTDDTPVTFCFTGPSGQRLTKKGYLFVWHSPGRDGPPRVMAEFRLGRDANGPLEFLKGRSPVLLCDGYSGYDPAIRQNEIRRAGCWAHARRYFVEAFRTGDKSAARVLVHIQRLFWIERAIDRRRKARNMDLAAYQSLRTGIRQRRSIRVVKRIFERALELHTAPATLPKSKLGRALTYLFNQKSPPSLNLTEPRIPIHNNDSERDIRHAVLGRKNWQVFARPKGGDVAARMYTLVLSAKLAGIIVQEYIEDVLRRFAENPRRDPAPLTPWAAARQPAIPPA
jgi:transposase